MRLYLVQCDAAAQYAGSRAEASKMRMAMMEEHGVKRSEVSIDEAEVPTKKAELVAFLNEMLSPVAEE